MCKQMGNRTCSRVHFTAWGWGGVMMCMFTWALSGIYSGVLSGIFWHSIWQKCWLSIWHSDIVSGSGPAVPTVI